MKTEMSSLPRKEIILNPEISNWYEDVVSFVCLQ